LNDNEERGKLEQFKQALEGNLPFLIFYKLEKIIMLEKLYNPTRRDTTLLVQIIKDQEKDIWDLIKYQALK